MIQAQISMHSVDYDRHCNKHEHLKHFLNEFPLQLSCFFLFRHDDDIVSLFN